MSGVVPAATLAAIRAAVTAALDLTCEIQRATVTADAWGSQQETFTTIATTQCNLAKPTAQISQQYAARLANLQAWTARFAYGTDVREGDVVVVNGQSLTVQALLTPISYPVDVRALLAAAR